jgi:two-component system chemotaxis response regulator CheB
MSEPRIVAIGASAGGVSALRAIVERLPLDLPAALCVVLHVPAGHHSRLPEILNYARRLPAAHAADGERIQHGRIYVAPPDHQLLIGRDFLRVVRGPRENRQRPAIDPLFRSAARAHGSRVVGIVLSGALDDGTAGLREIKARGGLALVQDPDEAENDSMPRSAMEHVRVDFCLPIGEMAAKIVELVRQPPPPQTGEPPSRRLELEVGLELLETEALESDLRPGKLSTFTCPECHGPLWELDEGDVIRYRCRVGHGFSSQTMLIEQAQSVERALWVGLRALEENAALARRLATRAREQRSHYSAQRFADRADQIEAHAETLRSTLQAWELPPDTLLQPAGGKGNTTGEDDVDDE